MFVTVLKWFEPKYLASRAVRVETNSMQQQMAKFPSFLLDVPFCKRKISVLLNLLDVVHKLYWDKSFVLLIDLSNINSIEE